MVFSLDLLWLGAKVLEQGSGKNTGFGARLGLGSNPTSMTP